MITLTDAAINRILVYAERVEVESVIKFGVKKSSCSAYSYTMDLDDDIKDTDEVVDCSGGIRFAIAKEDVDKFRGIHIDLVKEGLSERFEISNPNEKGTCGCGASFVI